MNSMINQCRQEQLLHKEKLVFNVFNEQSQKQNISTNHLNNEQQLIKKRKGQFKRERKNIFAIKKINKKQQNKDLKQGFSCFARSNSQILKKGFTEQKTKNIFFEWQKKYLVLSHEKLQIFDDLHRSFMSQCLNFKHSQIEIEEIDSVLQINQKKSALSITFRFPKQEDRKQWKCLFNYLCSYYRNQQKIMLKTCARSFYQHKDYLTQNQFLDVANTGDLILFKTKNTGASIQRFFTSSNFDHVAMIVKGSNGRVVIFQSNANHGVSIFQWGKYIKYFNLFEKVVFRKLRVERSRQKIEEKLLEFAKQNLGKKYDLNAKKLFRLETNFDWESVNEDRGYFCSQLIAKAYKAAQLIKSNKSCSRFWPVDFSEKGELLLRKGAGLGSQISILLNKHLKQK